jgi:hypothetical protein
MWHGNIEKYSELCHTIYQSISLQNLKRLMEKLQMLASVTEYLLENQISCVNPHMKQVNNSELIHATYQSIGFQKSKS